MLSSELCGKCVSAAVSKVTESGGKTFKGGAYKRIKYKLSAPFTIEIKQVKE